MNFFEDRENWSKNSFLDPDTGICRTEYYFKRIKAYQVQIRSPNALKLAGYTLIEKDLRTIIGWLEKLKELQPRKISPTRSGMQLLTDNHENDELIKGLFLAALIFYGKCFTECKGRKAKLERSNIGNEFLKTHDSIMQLRNNYGAHSGEAKMERVDINYVLNPKKKYKNEKHALVREVIQPESMCSTDDDRHDFYHLVNHIRNYTVNKLDKLNAMVFERDINPKGIDYWYEKAKKN